MCVIIDTNAFSSVFKKTIDHDDFTPLLNWLETDKGCWVYGGTKYKEEINKASFILSYMSELEKSNKLRQINDTKVDQREIEIKNKINSDVCDDTHLIAIVIESGCSFICSKDNSADRFLKDRRLYPSNINPPKIYRNKNHKNLLNPHSIKQNCCYCRKKSNRK